MVLLRACSSAVTPSDAAAASWHLIQQSGTTGYLEHEQHVLRKVVKTLEAVLRVLDAGLADLP